MRQCLLSLGLDFSLREAVDALQLPQLILAHGKSCKGFRFITSSVKAAFCVSSAVQFSSLLRGLRSSSATLPRSAPLSFCTSLSWNSSFLRATVAWAFAAARSLLSL